MNRDAAIIEIKGLSKHFGDEPAITSIDLKITPGERRKWIGLSGHNIPSFEIYLSPDWRGTEGIYYANLPSYKDGNYVEGIRFESLEEVIKKSTQIDLKAEPEDKSEQGKRWQEIV